jgi:hypothetical protein
VQRWQLVGVQDLVVDTRAEADDFFRGNRHKGRGSGRLEPQDCVVVVLQGELPILLALLYDLSGTICINLRVPSILGGQNMADIWVTEVG